MLKNLLFACFFISAISAFAQDSTSYLKSGQLKVNAILLGGSLSYEQKISNTSTINFEGSIGYGFAYRNSSFDGQDYLYSISPAFSIEGRHYYHFKQRLAKHREISNNSSNFWSLQAGYVFKPVSKSEGYTYSDALLVMPAWGIQRNLGANFSFELLLGLQAGYYVSSDSWFIRPGTGLKIGYVIK